MKYAATRSRARPRRAPDAARTGPRPLSSGQAPSFPRSRTRGEREKRRRGEKLRGGSRGQDTRRLRRRTSEIGRNDRPGARAADRRRAQARRPVDARPRQRPIRKASCAAQAPHHPLLRDRAFLGALHEAIFAQRPVFWRKSTLGAAAFSPTRRSARRAHGCRSSGSCWRRSTTSRLPAAMRGRWTSRSAKRSLRGSEVRSR